MRKILALTLMMLAVQLCAQTGAADWHSHIITPAYRQALARHGALLEEGFPLPAWSAEEHLKMMDSLGIQLSILSLPAPHPAWGDSAEDAALIRQLNAQCDSLQRQHPARFRFAATLSLPHVEDAIREARYALDTLGAVAVKLASNTRGQYLGDPALEPLMQELNEREATVIIHPHRPWPVNEDVAQAAPFAIYEYPTETTRAVINLIARGVTSRYPRIRWIVPHCGSWLPLAIDRMKGVHPIMQQAGLMPPIDWSTATQNLYYDLAGRLSADGLNALLAIAPPSHLLYGSDYPYVPLQGALRNKQRTEQLLRQHPLTAAHADAILGRTLLK